MSPPVKDGLYLRHNSKQGDHIDCWAGGQWVATYIQLDDGELGWIKLRDIAAPSTGRTVTA